MNNTPPEFWEQQMEECRDIRVLQQSLSERGAAGWELVNVVLEQKAVKESYKTNRQRQDSTWYAFFKRRRKRAVRGTPNPKQAQPARAPSMQSNAPSPAQRSRPNPPQ